MRRVKIAMRLPLTIAVTAVLCLAANAAASQCTAASGQRRVVLLELYTSEGCDSCPPTDRWVGSLPARGLGLERVVVLGFHVDYWNYLGWTDPYAQKRFSERQRASMARSGARVVYTPQLLFDGRDYRPALARDDIRERITAANQRLAGAAISLKLKHSSGDSLSASGTVTIGDAAVRDSAHTYLALYENNLSNRITAGENRGKHLQHDFVVRELAGPFPVVAGKASDFSHNFPLAGGWKRQDIYVAAFVQNSVSGEVLQALALPRCG